MSELQAPAAEEIAHVSGVVVHALPEHADRVSAAIERMDGAEVAGQEGGKLVVVLEAPDEAGLNDLFCRITLMDEVLSAAIVSHYRDDPELLGGE